MLKPKLLRRQFLHLAASAAALPMVSRVARAQTYPSRPVRLIVGFPAGGGQDIVARLVGPFLSERLGQPVIIENRPGAGGNIGAEAMVNAGADGHTLLLAGSPNAVNASLYDKLSFNFIRGITPVAEIMRVPLVMEVNPLFPANTAAEFISYAKANPGKITFASAGIGTPHHVCGELFKMMTGVDMLHVPYRGGAPALTDLIGGQVQIAFSPLTESIEHIRGGKIRALAVTTMARSSILPAVPTLDATVAGFEASSWYGIAAPKNTPSAIVERLHSEVSATVRDPIIRARFADLGGMVVPGTSVDFGKLIVEETDKWAKVIRAANIKPE